MIYSRTEYPLTLKAVEISHGTGPRTRDDDDDL